MRKPSEMLFPTQKERFEDRRKEGQQRKLQDEFFDHATLLAISRLVTQGQFDSLDYPVSTGKEGGVFRATGEEGFRAVKVYRIGNAVFKRLPAYALDELKRESSERNYARMVYAWTRREHTILRRLRAAEVRAPQPYGYLRNVLVMEFVGADGVGAPRLHDVELEDPQGVFDDLVVHLRRMVVDARLVHGDISPYNVLMHEGRPVIIDVAQSMPSTHPQAKEILHRDVVTLARYFEKLEVDTDSARLFAAVGGDELPAPEH